MLLSRSLRMTSSSSATRSVSQAAFAERLPSQRSPVFQKLSEHDFKFFHQVIGSGHGYFKGSTTIGGMNIDYMKRYHGNSELALRPVSTEQVSKILKYCNENKLAVVPQGGNTGLVGGSVPVYDEIILSTSLMNQIISFDPISGILVCQSGCVLQNLLEYANSQGYQIPLDLGAKGSCQIGGNVATNAGGLRFMKYGSLRQNVRGLEVVLADGTIVADLPHQGSHHRRMDINQLFIGSEGTLGVITKVALQLQPLSKVFQSP
eukprot:TRINITY_DN4820_c0_g1_i2.p1 TRINITY_DN4820_c0_g1~~TRINITY_DN4820_c0_g1_i2.p1  ORF type:complete len:262 (+),score=42.30 TRINITY_DN4820_c0_g1_i2:256-1041(+)